VTTLFRGAPLTIDVRNRLSGLARHPPRLAYPIIAALAGLAGPVAADSGFLTVCDPFGPGHFGVPGTDACLRLSGDVRSEARYRTSRETLIVEPERDAAGPTIAFRRGQLGDDTPLLRTRAELRAFLTGVVMTEYGALTATAGFKARADTFPGNLRADPFGEPGHELLLERAHITWGRFSAGYGPSIFDFTPSLSYTTGYASEINTTHVAYTHPIGESTTLTLSLEDGGQREIFDASWGAYSRRQGPDVVARLRRGFDWGAAQAAAAIHPTRGLATADCCAPVAADAIGWAVMSGLEAYFDIGGTSGELLLNAAASRGGLSYLGIFDYPADLPSRPTARSS
jgi:hypothetical protein